MKSKILALILLSAVIITAGSGTPKLSPWDAWRMAYTSFEQGEEFRDKGEYTKAKKAFDKALEYYNMVRESRPDWNQKVIEERVADCEKESRRMSAFLGPAAAAEKRAEEKSESTVRSDETEKLRQELSDAKAELEILRRRNETRKNYESEISNLLRDQRILNERYSLLEKRYRAQEAKLAEPDTKVKNLEEQLVALRLQLDLARKESSSARQQYSAAVAERNTVRQEKQKLDNAKRLLSREITELNRQITSQKEQLSGLQQGIESAGKREQDLLRQLESLRKKHAGLAGELNTLQGKYREKLAAAGDGAAANKKLIEENKRLQESAAALRRSEEKLTLKTAAQQREIDSLRRKASADTLKSVNAEAALKENEAKLASVSKELEREKANSLIINRELESVRQSAGNSTAELKKLSAENNALKKRLQFRESEDFKNMTAAKSELKKLKAELLKSEQTSASLRTELKISGEKYAALERSGRELHSENRKLHAERIKYEDRLKTLTGVSANSRELARQYSELKQNFAALQAENRQNKLAAEAAKPREAELARIKLRLTELDGLKQQLRREQSFNEQLNAVKNRLERDLRQLRPMGEENARLKAQLGDHQILKSEVERLRKLNRELAEAQKLETLVADLKMQLAKVAPEAAEAAKLRRQNQELIQGKVLWENENAKMKLKLAVIPQLEQQLKSLQADLGKSNDRLSAANRSISQLSAENRTLSTSVNDLETLRTRSRRLVEDQAKTLQQLRSAEEELRRNKVETASLLRARDEAGNRAASAEQKLRDSENAAAALKEQIGQLKELSDRQSGIEKKLKKELSELRLSAKQSEGSALQHKLLLTERSNEIGQLKLQIKKLTGIVSEKKVLEEKLARLSNIEKLKEQSDRNTLRVMQNLKESEKIIASLRTQISRQQKSTPDNSKLNKALAEIDAVLRLKQKSDNEAAQALRDLKEREKIIDSLHNEIALLKKTSSENSSLKSSLDEARKELEMKDKSVQKALQSAALAQRKNEEDAKIISNLQRQQEELNRFRAGNERLRQTLAQTEKELREVKAQSRRFSEESARRSGDSEKILNALRKENALLKSVNEKNINLEQELAGSRTLNTRMRSELEQLLPIRDELKRLSSELKKSSDESAILKKQNERLLAAAAEGRRIAAENSSISRINRELSNRSLKAESELASLKSELANYNRLRSEVQRLRKLSEELADAKSLAPELAQAKLRIANLEQMRDELVRQRQLNEELSRKRAELEKELAARPMPAFAPADYTAVPGISTRPLGKAEDYVSAGRLAEADEKSELAVWNYRTALKLEPENSEAAELLGKLLALRGDYAEAAPMLSRARNAKPDSIELALATAHAYIELKRFGNAEAVIAPLFKRDQENPRLQIAAALIAAGNGQHARAAGLLRLAAARLPEDPQPKLELARLLCNTDASRIYEAVKLYETARRLGAPPDLELEPKLLPLLDKRRNTAIFLTAAAAEAAKNKDWNSVIWYNRQLMDLDREPEKYRPRLAFAQYKKGSSGAALETLSMGSNTPQGLIVKAFIHRQRKEHKEARLCAQQAKILNRNRVVVLPAEWSEFIPEFRRYGGELTSFAR